MKTGNDITKSVKQIIITAVLAISMVFSVGVITMTLSSCAHEDNTEGTPKPNPVIDTTPPSIKLVLSQIDITGVEEILISGNELHIGGKTVASWTDNVTKSCKVQMTIDGSSISSGDIAKHSGTLTLTVTDDAGNSACATIKLTMQESFPDLTVTKPEVNVFGGVMLQISGNKLLIGGEEVASWSDKIAEPCKATLTLNGQEVKDGDVISQTGKLTLTVTNNQEKSSSVDITLVNYAISGLDYLRSLSMQVDQEVNIMLGLDFANDAELVKVEIEMDGTTTKITDPTRFTPRYPGICNIVFTVKGKNGDTEHVRVENLTIKPLDYTAAKLETAKMVAEKYTWYNNLQLSTRDFIYPHLQASYAACNWSKQANRVHIIMGETTDADDVENIGQFTTPSEHAYEGYYRIRALCPNTPIKGCYDQWINLENYLNQHPDMFFLVSCAADTGGGDNWEQMNNNPNTPPQRSMLEKENVILICANGNLSSYSWKTWNENVKNGVSYNSCSINSKLKNKVTVVGYHPSGVNDYFSPSASQYGGLSSSMPVGFEKDKGNIVMPMIGLVTTTGWEDTGDSSSYPTAVTSGVLGNAISIIMSNRAGITAEDAMTIICNNYLREETFQYKDETTNYELTDGDKWYFIEMQKLLDNELLQAKQLNSLQLTIDDVKLPDGKGICYMGIGVQFEFNGKRYDCTNNNLDVLQEALKSGTVNWYWNKDRFHKFGGTTTATLKVSIVDLNANLIPDLFLEVNKSVN